MSADRFKESAERSRARRMIERQRRIARRQATLLLAVVFGGAVGGQAIAGGDPALDGQGERLDGTTTAPAPYQLRIDRLTDANAALRVQLKKSRDEQRRLKQVLAAKQSTRNAIAIAAVTYRVPASHIRAVAHCESRFDPNAIGRPTSAGKAVGLMQFMPATWRSTRYASISRTDPYASALAAAEIASREGWRQWECKP